MRPVGRSRRTSLCRVATVPFSLFPVQAQIEELSQRDFDVTVVCSPTDDFLSSAKSAGPKMAWGSTLRYHPIEIARAIHPIRDLKALIHLFLLFRREKFEIVHSITPKAGLLTAIAGFFARVPLRLHTFTGQIWISQRGLLRFVTRTADKLIGNLCTCVYADGPGQAQFLVDNGIVSPEKINVIMKGSIGGLDVQRFDPAKFPTSRADMRATLGIDEGAFVFGFVGRINRDKGIVELLTAFETISKESVDAHLVLIGPMENQSELEIMQVLDRAALNPKVHRLGFVDDLIATMMMFDVLCLPSYREGFNGAVLQAAALEIPTLGSDIYGINDNLVNGVTGMLVPAKDAVALITVMRRYLGFQGIAKQQGRAARAHVVENFDFKKFSLAVANEYKRLISMAPRRSLCGQVDASVKGE